MLQSKLQRTSKHVFYVQYVIFRGPGSVVGITTGYGLDGPGIETRWGVKIFRTCPDSASCTMGTGSFPGVKSGRSMTLTPHPILVPWLWKSGVIPLLPLWACTELQCLYKGALYLLS